MTTYVGDTEDKATPAVKGTYIFGNGPGGVGDCGITDNDSYGVFGSNGSDLGLPGAKFIGPPAIPGGAGVYGFNNSEDNGPGVCGATGGTGNGVQGTTGASGFGVYGESSSAQDAGVAGVNTAGDESAGQVGRR